jgi:hypothetical protein
MENKVIVVEIPPHKLYLTKSGFKNYKEMLIFKAKQNSKLWKIK